MCGERRLGVLCKGADSPTVQLSPWPALPEAVERGGCGTLQPASAQLQTQQHPLSLEEAVWTAACEETRCYPRPANYRGTPCRLAGSPDGLARKDPLKAGWLREAEGVWKVVKGMMIHCFAAALVEICYEYARARGREENRDQKKCIM